MSDEAVRYIVSLAQKNYEAVGFLPQPRLEEYVQCGQVLMAEENGEPCGFLVYGTGWPTLKIYQACIQYDARRREHGIALVGRLILRAKATGHTAISLWCANDLEANEFWRSAGFSFAGQKPGGAKRGRLLNLWIMQLGGDLFTSNAA